MKIKDLEEWTQQLTEFEADDLSRKFRDFLLEWGEEIDRQLAKADLYAGDFSFSRITSKSLEVTEQTLGFLSAEWIAQMLLVMVQHWVYGTELYEGLTYIEARLVDQATAVKLADLARSASISVED